MVNNDKIDILDLMRKNELFQTFMEESIEPIWCFEFDKPLSLDLPEDEQFKLLYSHAYLKENNRAYAQVAGYERREDLLGMRLSEIMPPSIPENAESIKQVIRAGYNLRDFVTVEFYKKKKIIALNNVRGVIKDGKLLRLWGTGRDITAQKAAEDELREAELRYRTIADFTYDWETWEEPDGSYNYVSPSFERITGYASQQLVKNPELINEIILPDDLNLWEEHHQRIHARHEAAEILFRIRAKDGKIRWIEHICQPVFNDNGDCLGVRASNRDITKRKQSEIKLRNALKEIELLKDQLQAESAYLQDEIKLEHNFENIIGHSEALKYVLYRVAEVAPTEVPILIMGETGTGKELIARAIHNLSSRNKRALLKLNCAALPASVIESELFGHEKGAYTGADFRRMGRFQMADGATLFLDEISEIPLELQSKLLQVLQDGEFEPLGSSKTLSVDVRIIAASNRDLEDEVNHGRFRRDLFYRINVFPFTVPPLRNRKEDIPLLVKWFVDMFNRKMDKNITSIPKELIRHLQAYDWPGNVRELENVIERAVITSKGSILKLTDNLVISAKVRSRAKLKETLTEVERTQILNTLENTGWKIEGVNGAAGVLGLAPSTLRDRIKKLGIRHPMK
jgi:chemotaxis protein methyltransferase CheR